MAKAKSLNNNILSGASIRAVLHPRPDVQFYFPNMIEAFDLCHVILKDDKFFGKTAASHAIASTFGEYDMTTAFSYAYSNHYSYVVNSNYIESDARLYNKNVYKKIEFIPVDNHELIWDSNKNTSVNLVKDAITKGRGLKIALLDSEGYWNIHPIHKPSFHIKNNDFELFTDQDAIPDFFRDRERLDLLEEVMKGILKKSLLEHSPKNLRDVFDNAGFNLTEPTFYSTFYTVWSNGEYLRAKSDLDEATPEHYESLKVFADKIIEN